MALRSRARRSAERAASAITVSVGFSELKSGDSPSAAIQRADRAVYYAKTHGRNQVQSHAELVSRGAIQASEKVGDVELF